MIDERLAGKVAVVTGAGRGIGAAIARGLARAGATVVLTDLDGDSAERRAAELVAEGFIAHGHALDVADTAATRAYVGRAADRFGRIDVLVNNAGVMIRQSALETTEEAWDRQHAVNLRGLFFCAQAAARVMARQRSGAIVNVASTSAIMAAGSSVAYYTTKAGVIVLTRDLAGEWGPLGIRVNCVAPGGITTAMTSPMPDPVARAQAASTTLLGHVGEPDDLVGPVVFLASDDASYVNGATLIVDGGETFWRGPKPNRSSAPPPDST